MKLEIKHLAPYLPYELKMIFEKSGRIIEIKGLSTGINKSIILQGVDNVMYDMEFYAFKPLLRSDLTKEIEVNGERFVPIDKLYNSYGLMIDEGDMFFDYYEIGSTDSPFTGFNCIQKLISWRFDVFSLIPAGLAIDLNTLSK